MSKTISQFDRLPVELLAVRGRLLHKIVNFARLFQIKNDCMVQFMYLRGLIVEPEVGNNTMANESMAPIFSC
jgi:hypothetical protein